MQNLQPLPPCLKGQASTYSPGPISPFCSFTCPVRILHPLLPIIRPPEELQSRASSIWDMAFRGSSYFKVFKADGTAAESLGAAPAAAAVQSSDCAAAVAAAEPPAGPQRQHEPQEGNTITDGGNNGNIKGGGEDAKATWPPGSQ